MNKQFVPYELAVKLKEFGFDGECVAAYTIGGDLYFNTFRNGTGDYLVSTYSGSKFEKHTLAPLWQQAFDWLLLKSEYGIKYWGDGSGRIITCKDPSISYPFSNKEQCLVNLLILRV